MKKYRFTSLLLILSLILTNLVPALQVSAQGPMAFGEINAVGDVKILSSTGQWVEMKGVYPLLKQTELKIQDGNVFITTKDGSKIDLLKHTEAVIKVENSVYTVEILNCTGNVSFNLAPSEKLIVTTPETTRVIVQKDVVPSPSNVQGAIINKENGTVIKGISGKFNVSHHGLRPQVLSTGESLTVGGECIAFGTVASAGRTPTGAGAAVAKGNPNAGKIITGLTVGLFVTGATIVSFEAFRKEKVASPSVPR